MDLDNISVSAALLAGLISFFSPCVLPLVPVYLGYITGQMAGGKDWSRSQTILHALFFVLGFGLVFVVLGAAAGLVGSLIYPVLPVAVRIGGLILIIFGLHMTGLVTIPMLNVEKRVQVGASRRGRYSTSFVVGLVFALGWTPCVGPVLSGILLLAADSQTAALGAMLLAFYALGLGGPFLVVAALLDAAGPALKRLNRRLRIVSIIGGLLLVIMGALLLLGWFDAIVFWFNSLG